MEKLKDFWSYLQRLYIDIRYTIKGIKNIFIWAPLLTQDREWDHAFLLIMMKKKLERMEKFFRKHGHHVGADKDADNMKIAINVIDRLLKDEYNDLAFVPHKKKYGESHMIYKNVPNSDRIELLIEYDVKPITKKEQEEERKLFLECCKKEEYLKKQDLEFLFNHLRKHLMSWWD